MADGKGGEANDSMALDDPPVEQRFRPPTAATSNGDGAHSSTDPNVDFFPASSGDVAVAKVPYVSERHSTADGTRGVNVDTNHRDGAKKVHRPSSPQRMGGAENSDDDISMDCSENGQERMNLITDCAQDEAEDSEEGGVKANGSGSEGCNVGDGVECKIRSCSPEVKAPALPFIKRTQFGTFTLSHLGTVLFDLEGYHDSDYIYPVGFRGSYDIMTADDKVVTFLFEICYDGRESGGPGFLVRETAADESVLPQSCVSIDPNKAWETALKRVGKNWSWSEEETPDGRTLYGLSTSEVRLLIERSPGAAHCGKYRSAGADSRSKAKLSHVGGGSWAIAFEEARIQRNSLREKDRRIKVEEREREKQERIRQREQERMQLNVQKEKEKQEAQRRRDQQRRMLHDLRQKRQQEIDKAKETRRVEVETHRDHERRIKDQQRTAKMLAGRETMVDDLELLEIQACSDPDLHEPWKEDVERFAPNPAVADELHPSCPPTQDKVPDELQSEALEIFEFISYFGQQIGCKRLEWDEFQDALMSPSCSMFHGLHVQLVRLLFFDLPSSEDAFRGRPLNSLTWPELLRQYLEMLEQEQIDQGLEALNTKMELPDMMHLLAQESYEELPVAERFKLLGLNIYLALETQALRQFVDEMCEHNAKSMTQKRESFQLLLREERGGTGNVNVSIHAEPGRPQPSLASLNCEQLEAFIVEMQRVLADGLNTGMFGPESSWATESGRASEMLSVTCKNILAKLSSVKAANEQHDWNRLKEEFCEGIQAKILRCSVDDDDEWKRAVGTLLVQAQHAVENNTAAGKDQVGPASSSVVEIDHDERNTADDDQEFGKQDEESAEEESYDEESAEEEQDEESVEEESYDSSQTDLEDSDQEQEALPQTDGAMHQVSSEEEDVFDGIAQIDGVGEDGGEGDSNFVHLPKMVSPSAQVPLPMMGAGGSGTNVGLFDLQQRLANLPSASGQHANANSLFADFAQTQAQVLRHTALQAQQQVPQQQPLLQAQQMNSQQLNSQQLFLHLLQQNRQDARSTLPQVAVPGASNAAALHLMQATLQQLQSEGKLPSALLPLQQQQQQQKESPGSQTQLQQQVHQAFGLTTPIPGTPQVQQHSPVPHPLMSVPKAGGDDEEEEENLPCKTPMRTGEEDHNGASMVYKDSAVGHGEGGGGGVASKPPKKGADKDPNMPKRPKTAFFIYSNDVREKVRQDNPGITFGDISRVISTMWKEMDQTEKEPFFAREREDKERYQIEMADFRRSAGLPENPTKKRRSGSSAAHVHLRSIDDLGLDEIDESAESDAVLGKRSWSAGVDAGRSERKASLNSSSRKTSARPKRRGPDEAVDWCRCDDCGSWRFFDPGLDPAAVSEARVGGGWTCSKGGRQCGKFEGVEDFMLGWTKIMGSDAQQELYTFILEGVEFTVYELYWSVMALGGYDAVQKWKDVGNEMMWRKLQCVVSKAPGKNYSLLKNQWDRWSLSEYSKQHASKPVPEHYKKPCFDPDKAGQMQSVNAASSSGGNKSPIEGEDKDRSPVAVLPPARKEWKGRPMWPRKVLTAKAGASRSPVQAMTWSPVQLDALTPESLATLEQTLPPVPVHQPLPALPDLTYDEKLELRLQKSFSYVRGLRKEEVAASRDHSRAWLARGASVSSRSDPLGMDRCHRRYWVFGNDFSRIWVEKADSQHRDVVKWGFYSTIEQVDLLLAALNPHGIRENALREAIQIHRKDLVQAMSPSEAASASVPAESRNAVDNAFKSASTPVRGESGHQGIVEASRSDADVRSVHSHIRTHAERVLSQKCAHIGKSIPDEFAFSQALFGPEDSPELDAGRRLYAVIKSDRTESAGTLSMSTALSKLKGDMLLMHQALDSSALLQFDRDKWIAAVRDAQNVAELSTALGMFVDCIHRDWIQPWFYGLVCEARSDHLEEERIKPKIATSIAMLALHVYGLDEAILHQGPIKSNSGASQKKNKRLMSAEK